MAIRTVEELSRAGDIGRCELVRGKLRRMIPSGDEHGRITATLAYLVERHVREHRSGLVHGAETGFILARAPDTVRAPDLAFTSAERVRPATRGFVAQPPDLAVEVLSPDDRPGYVREKVAEWIEAGAREVWVVDPRTRQVAVHARGSGARLLGESEELTGGRLLPGFSVRVRELFP